MGSIGEERGDILWLLSLDRLRRLATERDEVEISDEDTEATAFPADARPVRDMERAGF